MRRTCDNKQINIVTEVLSIVHCRVLFAYCIMLTKRRAVLLKFDWVSLSVIAILLCTFIAHSGEKEVGYTVQTTRQDGFRIGVLKI